MYYYYFGFKALYPLQTKMARPSKIVYNTNATERKCNYLSSNLCTSLSLIFTKHVSYGFILPKI